MRSTRFLRVLVLAGLVPALAACEGSTEPLEPLASTYVLSLVDGAPTRIIADERTPLGVRQLYTMDFDSVSFLSATTARRRLQASVESIDPSGAPLPVVTSGYAYTGRVLRRRDRVIVEYESRTGEPIRPDTFTLRAATLVKMGPFGTACSTCPPVRRVEYVYQPGSAPPAGP
ncbi:MAG TPA: hypothetical protein VLK84_15660 [Longimicrobium sp.]|nr:hypothetical protein [Longimicrobium sp.]